ncbi:MAG: cation transporter [Oscillospiraceae bacterium]|nr:cation transporter [Oscillospiraceae bacterium]
MKTERNIFAAFILNLCFSLFEFIGGAFTGSVAIMSDAVHDLGDALGIGVSWIFERKSKKQPDETYSFGYGRYSVIGGAVTTLILLVGSAVLTVAAVKRIFVGAQVKSGAMIVFAVIGIGVNAVAAWVTRGEGSLNQKAVNLHMLEDVLGWAVVLVGAVVIKFTGLYIIDPLMSIGVGVFIFIHGAENLKQAVGLLAERVPDGFDSESIRAQLCAVEGVQGVHHIHVWSIGENQNCATMHVVTQCDTAKIKNLIRHKLEEVGISHVTVETEMPGEACGAVSCAPWRGEKCGGHHHHHHH